MKLFMKYIAAALVLSGMAVVYTSCEKSANFKIYSYPDFKGNGLSPASGYPTIDVTITGSDFGTLPGAVKVYFGGVLADTIRSCTDNQIVVKVPANAVSGKVTLKIWTHTTDSVGSFTVIPMPVIKSVSADAGAPGDVITIKGTGFGTDVSKLAVSFHGTSGVINTVVADTLITATVPGGFSSGNIVLYVNNFPVTGPGFAYLVAVPNPIYQLDFDGNLNDKMGGTASTYIQGALGNPLTYVTGINGQCVYLPSGVKASTSNDIEQTISLPAQISNQAELSVSCWVNWLGANDWEPVFDFGETRGNRINFLARAASWWNGAGSNAVSRMMIENKPGFTGYNEYDNVGNKAITANTWHHVVYTISSASLVMKMYIDGALAGTKTLPSGAVPTIFSHSKVYVGGQVSPSSGEYTFGGKIDKLQLFNSVLSVDQVYTLYYKK